LEITDVYFSFSDFIYDAYGFTVPGNVNEKTAKIAADESLFNYKTNCRFFEGVLDLPM